MPKKTSFPLFASACLVVPVLLSGCAQVSPNWMPNGYTYHHQSQITDPPKTADWYETAYAEAPESARYALSATLRGMAKDMVATYAQTNSAYGVPVYVRSRYDIDALNGAYDDALRTAFKDFGFVLANTPEGAQEIVYHASLAHEIGEHRLLRPRTTTQALGIDQGIDKDMQGYLFSLVQLNAEGDIAWQEARLQPLPLDETQHYGSADYQRPPGPFERKDVINRD